MAGFLKQRFPVLSRIASALFAKGGDITLPAASGQATGPEQPPITVSVPHGILRDRANQSLIVTGLFIVLNMFDVNIGLNEAQATELLNLLSLVGAAVAGWFRTRDNNITRG